METFFRNSGLLISLKLDLIASITVSIPVTSILSCEITGNERRSCSKLNKKNIFNAPIVTWFICSSFYSQIRTEKYKIKKISNEIVDMFPEHSGQWPERSS